MWHNVFWLILKLKQKKIDFWKFIAISAELSDNTISELESVS